MFVAAYLKQSRPQIKIISIDGTGKSSGHLSVNYSEQVEGKAYPQVPTAYYVPYVLFVNKRIRVLPDERSVVWNKQKRTAQILDLQHNVIANVSTPLPYIVADTLL